MLHFTGQHPFHHFHGFGIGHAHALDELALLAQAVERRFDLRAAAVHHHRVHAHQLEQHHVFGKVGLQGGVGHGVAAVLDDHGLAMELANVGQRLGQNFSLVAGAIERRSVMEACHPVKTMRRKLCRIHARQGWRAQAHPPRADLPAPQKSPANLCGGRGFVREPHVRPNK